MSDRDAKFTSQFWRCLQEAMGTKLQFGTTFRLQTDGQSERTIQTLEDMLRSCVLQLKDTWDSHLALIEFAYNNSYHSSIETTPYEELYGRQCRTHIRWNEGVMRFGKHGKLSPRYIGPYEIIEHIGLVAYKLALPQELSQIHDVFHVSIIRKYMLDPSHVLERQPVELREDLTYEEQHV
ncbi:hypothetical protein L3X38_013893 [Prunus dulcis]|uniref:Integrase catalytic domain-containing protein n=1 Tax=Prunus dulcis TaxID=3755 RepID=A0AAD4ZHF9_PRUDU|nr:hypothetical protein L3X38_013893 [Prunus dulcis]